MLLFHIIFRCDHRKQRLFFIFLLFFPLYQVVVAKSISPIQYGLLTAKTGEERYEVLYQTHYAAIREDALVDYSGINVIDLVIPNGAVSIPLTKDTDFSGVTFNVLNKSKNLFLFELTDKLHPLKINKYEIRKGRYKELRHARRVLLIIEDKTPWVEKRSGFDYGINRKEAIVLENGRSSINPIFSYSSKVTVPKAYYRIIDTTEVSFSNMTLNRLSGSTKITYLLNIMNQVDVRISHICIHTPKSNLTGDAAIRLENCVDVKMTDVLINNTYSTKKEYGYGVNLINVSNLSVDSFKGYGEWGVFGNHTINNAKLTNSELNRFDIHCYGKDIFFENCIFNGLYNQFSSMYGCITFNNCTFTDFIPVSLEASYNAYTGFDVFFRNCTFNSTTTRHTLINMGRIDDVANKRAELSSLCWPNVYIDGLKVYAENGANPLYIFACRGGTQSRPIEYISKVSIQDVFYDVSKDAAPIKAIAFCNKQVVISHPITLSLNNVHSSTQLLTKSISTKQIDGSFIFNLKTRTSKSHKISISNCTFDLIVK